MDKKILTIKQLLEVIFATINRSAGYFAGAYLLKDVSIISKWKSEKVTPKKEDISKIVEFVIGESTIIQQKTLRDKINILIKESSLSTDIKEFILCIEDFEIFLEETLTIAVSQDNSYFTTVIEEQKSENVEESTFAAEDELLLPEVTSKYSEDTSMILYKDNNLYSKPNSCKSNNYINKIRRTLVSASVLVIMASFILFEQLSIADDSKKPPQSSFAKSDSGILKIPSKSFEEEQEENLAKSVMTKDINEDSSINLEVRQTPEATPENNSENAEVTPENNRTNTESTPENNSTNTAVKIEDNSTNTTVMSKDNSTNIKEISPHTGNIINGDKNIQINDSQNIIINISN
ncbi:hypothetical protein [Acetivibrio mesophilus]|uniref:Uncharacterized protein n=1 Tax=Acetivibrio mesophilus TaxID=2487273 RepID=A0A4Q0I2Q8_9FIRM|nr:hypothetical protein [Acetivibrio mesophilus]RXE58524.1 hypothetical protein EFD62_12135 [Acetivibrio mesophilus]